MFLKKNDEYCMSACCKNTNAAKMCRKLHLMGKFAFPLDSDENRKGLLFK